MKVFQFSLDDICVLHMRSSASHALRWVGAPKHWAMTTLNSCLESLTATNVERNMRTGWAWTVTLEIVWGRSNAISVELWWPARGSTSEVSTPHTKIRGFFNFCGKGFINKKKIENLKMNIYLKLRPHRCRYSCDVTLGTMTLATETLTREISGVWG